VGIDEGDAWDGGSHASRSATSLTSSPGGARIATGSAPSGAARVAGRTTGAAFSGCAGLPAAARCAAVATRTAAAVRVAANASFAAITRGVRGVLAGRTRFLLEASLLKIVATECGESQGECES